MKIDFNEIIFHKPKNTQIEVIRYFIVAVIATLFDYAIYLGCYSLLSLNIEISLTIGFIIGIWINYQLSLHWAFANRSNKKTSTELLIFVVTGIIGLFINWIIIRGFLYFNLLDPTLSRIPAIACAFIWNFGSRKILLFSSKNKAKI
jgi:putative flippase GtrA